MPHKYTEEQFEFIKENVEGRISYELTEMFNAHFGLNLRVTQIRGFVKNHNLKSGIDTKFVKGQVSRNKGKKGINHEGMKATQFKKGNLPHNHLPVGSERINGEDYIKIKIAEPNKWKFKQVLIWEKHNGPVPRGHVVMFGDRNKRNFNLDNLILVSKKKLLIMNHNRLIQNDTELTKTGVIIAGLYEKINERKSKI